MVLRIGVTKKLYLGLAALLFVAANPESIGDSRQIG